MADTQILVGAKKRLFVSQELINDTIGKRFGRWIVLKESDDKSGIRTKMLCKCDCGNERDIDISNLRNKQSTSCGCLKSDLASKRLMKHGYARGAKRPAEYICWMKMIARCYDPKANQYEDYGGRGIKVCDEWRGENGFKNFLDHIGKKPHPSYSIDKIDNNRNYEPGNVRWADRLTQAHNKRVVKRNTSGVSGVWFDKRSDRWSVTITTNYKQKHITRTKDFFEACCARKAAENEYWRNAA